MTFRETLLKLTTQLAKDLTKATVGEITERFAGNITLENLRPALEFAQLEYHPAIKGSAKLLRVLKESEVTLKTFAKYLPTVIANSQVNSECKLVAHKLFRNLQREYSLIGNEKPDTSTDEFERWFEIYTKHLGDICSYKFTAISEIEEICNSLECEKHLKNLVSRLEVEPGERPINVLIDVIFNSGDMSDWAREDALDILILREAFCTYAEDLIKVAPKTVYDSLKTDEVRQVQRVICENVTGIRNPSLMHRNFRPQFKRNLLTWTQFRGNFRVGEWVVVTNTSIATFVDAELSTLSYREQCLMNPLIDVYGAIRVIELMRFTHAIGIKGSRKDEKEMVNNLYNNPTLLKVKADLFHTMSHVPGFEGDDAIWDEIFSKVANKTGYWGLETTTGTPLTWDDKLHLALLFYFYEVNESDYPKEDLDPSDPISKYVVTLTREEFKARFTFEKHLGKGVYGTVDSWYDSKLGKSVVTKKENNPKTQANLLLEAIIGIIIRMEDPTEIIRTSRVECILLIKNNGHLDEFMLVLDYIDGTTIYKMMESYITYRKVQREFTPHEFWSVCKDLTTSMIKLHELGLYHLDTHYGNAMVTHDRAAQKYRGYIIDFGISCGDHEIAKKYTTYMDLLGKMTGVKVNKISLNCPQGEKKALKKDGLYLMYTLASLSLLMFDENTTVNIKGQAPKALQGTAVELKFMGFKGMSINVSTRFLPCWLRFVVDGPSAIRSDLVDFVTKPSEWKESDETIDIGELLAYIEEEIQRNPAPDSQSSMDMTK